MGYPRFCSLRTRLIATTCTIAGALPNFAVAGLCVVTMIFTVAIATPASTQVVIQIGSPQVPGFSNNYPWFNDVPQYQEDQSFRWFMANNPDIAQALAQNPARLYDADWRSQFPALEEYLANHPYEWEALNGEYWSEGPAETQWGDYDDGQWRDAYWWHQNNPDWFYNNHMSWASLDSRWLAQDGAYDQQYQWHYGEWWYNQNPSWVTNNHPNWLNKNRNWATPAEQQNYRRQHAMGESNQQPIAQHQNANSTPRQQNQQRATDQQQANLQQQQTTREDNQRQEQANRQKTQENQEHASDQQRANLEQQQSFHQEDQRRQEASREQQPPHLEQQQTREQQSRPRQEHSDPQHHQENEHQQHENGDNHAK